MAITGMDGRVKNENIPFSDPLRERNEPRSGDFRSPKLISDNPQISSGRRVRRLMRWRVPGAGFLDMYINPQQLQIQERKIVRHRRTKGGYVVQYWGEEFPTITINGTTASAGIEGINILRDIYRAEQNAFEQVARSLSDKLGTFNIAGNIGNLVSGIADGNVSNSIGSIVGNAVTGFLGSGTNAPLTPTLASLALGVELFYQGWVFKGYFQNLTINESVSLGPGVFDYSMTFIVTDRRGIRSNFMEWHREPANVNNSTGEYKDFRNSNSSLVPPSFKDEK